MRKTVPDQTSAFPIAKKVEKKDKPFNPNSLVLLSCILEAPLCAPPAAKDREREEKKKSQTLISHQLFHYESNVT